MTYIVQTFGHYACPEFTDLSKARNLLKELVADSLIAARRKSKQATKHLYGKDNYMITLGRNRGSALWSHHLILKFA